MSEIDHLELLAQIDTLKNQLQHWIEQAPDWPPARQCRALVQRLLQRVDRLRQRLDAPLVVATLGGTGTGKSTLINAIVGREVCPTGKQRPTTRRPVLIVPPDIGPEMLGIDPRDVEVVSVDAPGLRHLVLLDCPDPDTTEVAGEPSEAPVETNLSRLRTLLPHCDVILVTATQQKYRSACVHQELLQAANGAHLVFVQTHADVDEDIRRDWQQQLAENFEASELLFVDSREALRDAQQGRAPQGGFGRLMDLLTRELAGAAVHRIRRINFLELLGETLARCRQYIQEASEAIHKFSQCLKATRSQLAHDLAEQLTADLAAHQHELEQRIRGEVVQRWGSSPFSFVLRLFHNLGSLLSWAWLARVRTPTQLAVWGVVETGRRIGTRWRRSAQHAQAVAASWGWNDAKRIEVRIKLEGYARDAGLPREELEPAAFSEQLKAAAEDFLQAAHAQVNHLVEQQARHHTRWLTRRCYDVGLLLVVLPILYRLGKNFFIDSWLGPELGWRSQPAPVLGTDVVVQAAVWVLVGCLLLVGLFSRRLRRGLRRKIQQLREQASHTNMEHWFEPLEAQIRNVGDFDKELERLAHEVERLRRRVALPTRWLGRKKAPSALQSVGTGGNP